MSGQRLRTLVCYMSAAPREVGGRKCLAACSCIRTRPRARRMPLEGLHWVHEHAHGALPKQWQRMPA